MHTKGNFLYKLKSNLIGQANNINKFLKNKWNLKLFFQRPAGELFDSNVVIVIECCNNWMIYTIIDCHFKRRIRQEKEWSSDEKCTQSDLRVTDWVSRV